MPVNEHDDIVAQLRTIDETLGERGMALLRQAIESGSGVRPPGEKVIAQARRAIDKAINLLGGGIPTDD